MQINVNVEDIRIEDGKVVIAMNSELEKIFCGNLKMLKDVKPGDVFNWEYIVLEHFENGTTAVVAKELLPVKMQFGETENWKNSEIRDYLNDTYFNKIMEEFGDENIVQHETNLLSLDGLDDYGSTKDDVSLLDIDQYRKYRKNLYNNVDDVWWLLTPNSKGNSIVQCVCQGGRVGEDLCNWRVWGVRPFFVLKSSIYVF